MKYIASILFVLISGLATAQTVVSKKITYRTESTVISAGTPIVVKTTNTDTQTVKQADGSVVKNVYNLVQTQTTTPITAQDKRYQITTVTLSNGTKQVTETLLTTTINTRNTVTPSTVKTLASSTIITPSPTAVVVAPPAITIVPTNTFNAATYYGHSPYRGTPTAVFSSMPKSWENTQYNNGANQYINSAAAWARGWTGKGSTVMVMDTGIDVNNPAFAGKIKYQLDITGTGLQDVVGHGTSIAGIVAGARNNVTPTGVAFDANLAVVKLSNTSNIVGSNAASALAWAANKPDIVVANLSANTNYAATYTASVKVLSPGIYASSDPNYGGKNYYNLESPQSWAQTLTPKLAVTVSAGNQSVPYPQNPATFATATDANGKLLLNGQMLVVGNWNAKAGRIEGAGAGTVCKNVAGTACLDQYKISDFYILAPGMLVNSVSPITVSATGTKAMSGTSQASAVAAGALAVVNQLWPYMTASNQVQLLLKTANKNLPGYNPDVMGQGLLDLDRATQPVGNLGIALNGRTNSTVPLSGGIALASTSASTISTLSSVSVVDSFQRDFSVDMKGSAAVNNLMSNPIMMDADPGYNWSGRWTGLVAGQNLQTPFSGNQIGADATLTIDSRMLPKRPDEASSSTIHQLTITNSTHNPFVNFSGAYGQTKSAFTTEYSALYQPGERETKLGQPQGWWAQGGAMMTSVNHTSGLVSNVTPIFAVHAMGGYQYKDWNLFAGIKPTVASGAVNFNVPTSVDADGTMKYTQINNSLVSTPIAYLGVKYQHNFNDAGNTKHSVGFRAQVAQDGTSNARAYYTANF